MGSGMRDPATYIMASRRNGTLYTGVTGNLAARACQHRQGKVSGFTKRYGCKLLVWYERYDLVTDAIAREKQLKAGSRVRKLALIEALNPRWHDLHDDLAGVVGGAVIWSFCGGVDANRHCEPEAKQSRRRRSAALPTPRAGR